MSNFYYFLIEGYNAPFGYVPSSVVMAVSWPPSCWDLDHKHRFLKLICEGGFEGRTRCVMSTLRKGHDENVAYLRKWANETMPVYSASGEHVLDMDLVGVDLFGVVTYGVHVTAYVMTPEGRKYWVPRRSGLKFSHPGMLDNAVAGNVRTGERALDRVIEKAASEASIPKEFTRANIRACGTVSYQMSMTNRGEFKPNTGMTWLAYFVRHGILNAENEADLVEICARLHRKHDPE